ncbi:ABC transporter permease [Cryptosporangium minutisporangium]|uniref:ABC transporter permease n=1 Tax=Cryptosporangium minutisporangium TaxID=113569 RepID=A0ABP6SXE3_9ACTN
MTDPTPRPSADSSATVTVPPADEHTRVEAAAAEPDGQASPLRTWLASLSEGGATRNIGLLVALIILCIVGLVTAETFSNTGNIRTILTNASVIGVVSVGMTFVIIGGGIDLSVGSIVGLASVWCTTVATQEYGPVVMVLCALLVGLTVGLINGVLIAYGRLVAFIVTLGMLIGARGLAQYIANLQTQVVTQQGFNQIADGSLLGVPYLVWLLIGTFVIGWVVLNLTTFGRRTVAVGGNPEAARLAGINVRLHTALLYGVSGLCCGLAAVMLTAQTASGSSTNGQGYELDAIAAVIIGGTLLTGGRGTLVGTFLGVLVFTLITNLFILNNLSTPVQNLAKGLIIIGAVLLQRRRSGAAT